MKLNIWIVLLLLLGCSAEEEWINIPSNSERFFSVEAYLTDNRKIEITVINNILLTDELIVKPVWYADVFVSNNEQEYALKNLTYTRSADNRFINYVSDDDISFEEGTLSLSIDYKDSIFLTAEASVLSPVTLDSVLLYDSQNVGFYFEKGEDTEYYKTLVYVYLKDTMKEVNQIHHIDATQNTLVINETIDELMDADSAYYILSKISKDHYMYERSVRNAILANIEPTVKADTIYSNIQNAKGIFTFMSNDTIKVDLSEIELGERIVISN
ncbi:hypothetical protein [Flammeovirga aprica]|uniref:DUF4249 family protein n=1 Tax=Flammeovirga aprica JL-4 TaxID=694437 RepID=A0A7X9RVG9_9BACT|nr:hypothetical protein [Flammeovirga aprica]NME69457.1 hypothetical protein [Flammeovirga aprica JL-4]